MDLLIGEAFTIDAAGIHIYPVNFIDGNEKSETKIQFCDKENNGQLDMKSLMDHYLGDVVYDMDVIVAKKTSKNISTVKIRSFTCGGMSLRRIRLKHLLLTMDAINVTYTPMR